MFLSSAPIQPKPSTLPFCSLGVPLVEAVSLTNRLISALFHSSIAHKDAYPPTGWGFSTDTSPISFPSHVVYTFLPAEEKISDNENIIVSALCLLGGAGEGKRVSGYNFLLGDFLFLVPLTRQGRKARLHLEHHVRRARASKARQPVLPSEMQESAMDSSSEA